MRLPIPDASTLCYADTHTFCERMHPPMQQHIKTTLPPPSLMRPIWLCLAALMASAAVFTLFPQIDIIASSWFYAPGQGFPLGPTRTIVTIRRLGIAITVVTLIALIVIGLYWRTSPNAMDRWPSATPRTDWWFMLVGLLLGPGLLVNVGFKPIFGRPRPVHIEQFGGKDYFTSAWVASGQCKWNCSFVSGEAAAAAFVLAFVFIVTPRWRPAALVTGVIVTLADSFARMAAGGHFLSDVVTAWLVIGSMLLILHAQFYHGALLGPLKRWWTIG
jgi:lipid A 4'-phosphatase